MPSERVQRQIDSLLDEAEAAAARREWGTVGELARRVLAIDAENEDAGAFLAMAQADAGAAALPGPERRPDEQSPVSSPPLPESFVGGRYRVLRLLGVGGRKRVFLARDTRLDREVAFALIEVSGLDAAERERILREARAMARLGSSPHLVSIFDLGEDNGSPFIVQEYMAGGDVAGVLSSTATGEQRAGSGLATARVLGIATDVCRALEAVHRAGIVHRDLKPANVFLASDGSAKVGDLGLATALEFTRVTQHGTMLGTVAYMPPEQAVGGDVTSRSDLYSLGCMLYELVTGRPPFVGDDATAVISQHLNTPPVAPSWLSARCPPALESVILGLLEKDPSQRPASAAEVLAALAKVNPDEQSALHSEGRALERLSRGVFVGREREIESLRKAFDDAFGGRGGLVMLVGEPGIGKTRTAQELETYARMRGAQVLWGRSHQNLGAPVFWPWIQAGRAWGAGGQDPTALGLGQSAGDLVKLFPGLRESGFVEPPPLSDPMAAQFRLFDAYASFLRAASASSPLVITLDDLHWADRPTLQLLEHVAREIGRLRVLILCTYRDTDLVRAHPLSEALAALNRDPGFERIVLRGLSLEEVRSYIASVAHAEPPRGFAERVHEETEGNPFFLAEVVNLLVQEGGFANRSVSDLRIPDGVREALGRRLDRLSEEANGLLQVAAVVGREFGYDVMRLLMQRSSELGVPGSDEERQDEVLLRLLEEGLAARVIEEMQQAGRYRFTHALMQETLLGELSTTRRVRLHGQVGAALERRWGDRADAYASRLANHFAESATLTPAHAERARRYLVLAAEQAEAGSGWAQAAALLDRALSLEGERDADPDPHLLLALGRNAAAAADYRPAWRSLRQALTRYEQVGDPLGYCRTALVISSLGANILDPGRQLPILEEAVRRLPEGHPDLEARLAVRLARVTPDQGAAERLAARARDLSVASGLPEVAAEADYADGFRLLAAGEVVAAVPLLTGAMERLEALGQVALAGEIGMWMTVTGSDLEDQERAAQRELAMGTRARQRVWVTDATYHLLDVRKNRGDLRGIAAEEREILAEHGWHVWVPVLLATCALVRGQAEHARALLPGIDRAAGDPWQHANLHACRAWFAALDGRPQEAAAGVAEGMRHLELSSFAPATYGIRWGLLATGAEVDPLRWGGLAREALDGNAPGTLDSRLAWGFYSSADYLRGRITLALGFPTERACEYFGAGLAYCKQQGMVLDAGLCLEGLGECRASDGDLAAAVEHFDKAASIFRDCGAKLFLDRVIARKVELQGMRGTDPTNSILAVSFAVATERPDVSLSAGPDGTVTLAFTDIENSTALTEQLGDARWVEILRAHNAVIEEQTKAHGGRVVKNRGDGYMLTFARPDRGLSCALAIQKALAGHDVIRVRIGLHTGSPQREGEDFFGTDVNLAARVADRALGGQVLISNRMHGLVAQRGSSDFGEPVEVELKGLSGKHRLYEVRWA